MTRKLKIRILVIITCLAGVLAVWMFGFGNDHSTDQANYRNLIHCSRSLRLLSAIQRPLPGFMVRFLHLPELEEKCWAGFKAEREALLASGYFVEIPLGARNPTTAATLRRVQMTFRAAGAYFIAEIDTNSIVVACRSQDRSLCEKAMKND